MGIVRIIKNKAYFKRYQVKLRRRRQCKTDYQQRRKLIVQDKNKYNTPKHRLVVRITNKDVIAQVVAAKVIGDQVICAAYSHELPRYGLKVGLTNYAACYATGLLLARRLLKKVGLSEAYEGKVDPDGDYFENDVDQGNFGEGDERRPFRCFLDVGLARTSTGARIFGVMKGAVDGGLDVPHSDKRFPGYFKAEDEDNEDEYIPDFHRKYIFGGHVKEYMAHLQEEDPDKYQKHFSQYIKEGVDPESIEEMYAAVHKAIRDNPDPSPKKKHDISKMKKYPHKKKMPRGQRMQRIVQKIERAKQQAAEAMDDE